MVEYPGLPHLIKQAVKNYLTVSFESIKLDGLLEVDRLIGLEGFIENSDADILHLILSGAGVVDVESRLLLPVNTIDRASSLVVLSYNVCGGTSDRIIELAVSVHLIFCAAGIFDDIQDQDKKYSLSSKVGTGKALNIGLLLLLLGQIQLNKTLEQLLLTNSGVHKKNFKDTISNSKPFLLPNKLVQNLIFGIRGQLLDLQENVLPLETQLTIPSYFESKNGLKAALMFSYLAELGAIAGNCAGSTSEIYREFGFLFGMITQLLSDLGDFLLIKSEQGNSSRDLGQRKITLPFIYACQAKSYEERRHFAQLLEMTPIPLLEISEFLKESVAVSRTIEQIAHYLVLAENTLRKVDPLLEHQEHQVMISMLHQFMQPLQSSFQEALKFSE
ncbi:MAG TPA: polyprenyl synthetase family protein [Chloroflexia bacterium]|nr:polyprenyl synthetase family protein [Chloroflexia bacterium]